MHAFDGEASGMRFGEAVASAGDVNGDSFADVIVGSRRAFPNGFESGVAVVHSGFDGGVLHAFSGEAPSCGLGLAVASAGDVDGDGRPDLLVGLASGPNGPWSGSARLYSGASGMLLRELRGDAAYDGFGSALGCVGDVDADGRSDVIVGVPGADATAMDSGLARVHSGADGSLLFELRGSSPLERFGSAVCGVGDVDRDGRPDFAVGAPRCDTNFGVDAGRVFVFSGLDGRILHSFDGWSHEALLGTSVAAAGDVDRDGHADVLVGAPNDMTFVAEGGNARIHSGRDGAILHQWFGLEPYERLGASVAGLGDVDGDGYVDIGSSSATEALEGTAVLRVHSGRDFGELVRFDAGGGDRSGATLIGAGDVNGDGNPDLLVGAPRADSNGMDAGSVLVLSGREELLAFCFGDGSGGPCACLNYGSPGEGCANSTGAGASLSASGSASLGDDALAFEASHLPPGKPALLFAGANAVNGGHGQPFGDGLRCAGDEVRRFGTRISDGNGGASFGRDLLEHAGWSAGDTRRFQVWYRDPSGPCGLGFNLSNGVEVVLSI